MRGFFHQQTSGSFWNIWKERAKANRTAGGTVVTGIIWADEHEVIVQFKEDRHCIVAICMNTIYYTLNGNCNFKDLLPLFIISVSHFATSEDENTVFCSILFKSMFGCRRMSWRTDWVILCGWCPETWVCLNVSQYLRVPKSYWFL